MSGWYGSGQRCLSCGLESAEKAELVAVLIAFAALFFGMAVCVATQSPSGLSRSVSVLLMVQHLSVVGKLAGQQVPDSLTWVAELFSVLSMLNFDLQFVKPGCVVGALSFLTVYWATYGLVALSSVMFIVASLIRAQPWRSSNKRQEAVEMPTLAPSTTSSSTPTAASTTATTSRSATVPARQWPWQWRFRVRLSHSHLILCSVLYLRLSILTMEALQCTKVQLANSGPLVSVLTIDLTTRCYEGGHLITVILLVWPTLFLFCLGFPLLSAWLLYRSFYRAAKQAVRAGTIGNVQDDVADELSAADGVKLAQLQKEQSLDQAWLVTGASSSSCTTPAAASHPSTPRGHRGSPTDWMRPGQHAVTSGQSHPSRVHPNLSASSYSPRSPNSVAFDPNSTNASPRRPLTPMAFASWSPSTTVTRLTKQSPAHEMETVGHTKPASAQPAVVLSPIQYALRQLGADAARQEQYGYLFRQLKGECYYFRLLFVLTSFGFASASVLPASPTLRLFLTGVFFLADQLIVLLFVPFDQPWRNLLSAGLSWVGVIQCLVMLALVQMGLSNGTSTQLDLGHSTNSQAASANPSDALTGVSYIAAYYEMVLGLLWLASFVVVVVVHRQTIAQAVRGRAIAVRSCLSRRQRESHSDGHKRLESKSWQPAATDSSLTPPTPVSVELTHYRAIATPDALPSPPRHHMAAMDAVPEWTGADPFPSRPVNGTAPRLRPFVSRISESQLETDNEPDRRKEASSHPTDEDKADEAMSSPGLLSSLTNPLAAPGLAPVPSAHSQQTESMAGRVPLPAAPRSLPPVRVQRLISLPESSAPVFVAPLMPRLPGAVDTPAGSRRESQY